MLLLGDCGLLCLFLSHLLLRRFLSLLLKSLDTDDSAQATPEMLELWLKEARSRHRVVVDEAELPRGVVAMVDQHQFDLTDLGRVLLPNASDEERAKFRAIATGQWQTVASQSENAQKVYDTLIAYLTDQGLLTQ